MIQIKKEVGIDAKSLNKLLESYIGGYFDSLKIEKNQGIMHNIVSRICIGANRFV